MFRFGDSFSTGRRLKFQVSGYGLPVGSIWFGGFSRATVVGTGGVYSLTHLLTRVPPKDATIFELEGGF